MLNLIGCVSVVRKVSVCGGVSAGWEAECECGVKCGCVSSVTSQCDVWIM